MKLAMKLTIDDLVRALRWQAHDLAEEAERGYRAEMRVRRVAQDPRGMATRRMGGSDDGASS